MGRYFLPVILLSALALTGCADNGRVEIVRDNWGVPNVFAGTDAGAMYGLGYATAEDRGFQMHYTLRTIQGRLAEVIGRKPHQRRRGVTTIQNDRKMRTFGFHRAAQAVAGRLDDETKSLLQAYCDGVNAYFNRPNAKLDPIFEKYHLTPEPWTIADCIASWWHVGQFFATDGTRDLMSWRKLTGKTPDRMAQRGFVIPELPEGVKRMPPDNLPAVVKREDVTDAWLAKVTKFAADHGIGIKPNAGSPGPKFSHAWVVGGKRTTTGSAVLVSDPQTPVRNPSLFYEYHVAGRTFNARGIGVAGSPVLLIGFTDRVAWGLTALGADQADLFRLKTDRERPDRYFFDGKWLPMTVRTETIKVRGGADVKVRIRETHFGPIVTPFAYPARGDGEVALKRVPVCEPDRETAQAFMPMIRARSARQFAAALPKWRFPTANCVYGDSAGAIGYSVIGAMPMRSRHALNAGRAAHDDAGSKYDWQGYVPQELLPQVAGPKRGFLYTANHRPIETFYPISFGQMTGAGGDTIRSWRLRERLEALERFRPEDVLAIHNDAVNPSRRDVVRLGLHLRDVQKAELSPEAILALEVLGPWHKAGASMQLTAPGASVANELNMFFRMMATPLAQVYGGGESGVSYWLRTATARLDANPKATLDEMEVEFVDRCLSGAMRSAGAKYGRDTSKWDANARAAVERRKLGWYVSLDGFGSVDRANDLSYPPLTCVDGSTILSQGGQCYTQYVPLHDADAARTILPIGNSERLGGEHRTDTMKSWAEGRLHPAPLTRKGVEKVAASRTTLVR